jgi:hypothetical protein
MQDGLFGKLAKTLAKPGKNGLLTAKYLDFYVFSRAAQTD